MATNSRLGPNQNKENENGFNGDAPKLKVTLASNAEGWDKMMNGQLENELAHNPSVKVSGFVPQNTQEQREHARELNIELFDAKLYPGYSLTTELLNYPPEDLKIDILMMHSYGRDVGRQAQIIKEAKDCKWVLVAHTISEELEKFVEKSASHTCPAVQELSEHELQVTLCEKADLVVAVGPKVAEAYRAALQYCGKHHNVVTLIPGISEKYLGVRDHLTCCDAGEKFRVLISGSSKYFKVKGCDIASQAITLLQDPSYHLILVVQPNDDTTQLEQAMHKEGISVNQLTVRKCSGDTATWCQLLCEVNLLIKPSRTEGFGMSGLRAISANLPVLISGNTGLGMALKMLPSGGSSVVDSEDPQVWANKIREVRVRESQTCRSGFAKLKVEYLNHFKWKEQSDNLVKTFFEMIRQDHEGRRAEQPRHGIDEADAVDGRSHEEEMIKLSIQESNPDHLHVRRSTKLLELPKRVYQQTCRQLNIRRDENFDDFRFLAEKVGFSRDEIRNFEEKSDPTDEILKAWSSRSDAATVGKLIDLLNGEGLERRDVAKILQEWVNQ